MGRAKWGICEQNSTNEISSINETLIHLNQTANWSKCRTTSYCVYIFISQFAVEAILLSLDNAFRPMTDIYYVCCEFFSPYILVTT